MSYKSPSIGVVEASYSKF